MRSQEPLAPILDFPMSVVQRLLISIIVKQHLSIPDNDLNRILETSGCNPNVTQTVKKLFSLNKQLLDPKITGSLKDNDYKVGGLPWHHLSFLSIIRMYSDELLKLGFSLEEQRELFPPDTAIANVVPLKEQALLKIKEIVATSPPFKTEHARAWFYRNLPLLPLDLRNYLNDSANLINIAKQLYINKSSNWMTVYRRYLARLRLDLKLMPPKKISKTYLRHTRAFVENRHLYGPPVTMQPQVPAMLTFLLKMLTVPDENLLQHFDETVGFNLAHFAAAYAPSYILSKIIELPGFDIRVPTKVRQYTLLHLALGCTSRTFDFLMTHYQAQNPILNEADADRVTPLHTAVRYRNLSRVRRLVEAGAALNPVDNYGMVPLHSGGSETLPYLDDGTEEEWGAILAYLIAKGAALEVFNKRIHGRHTPYEYHLVWGLNSPAIKKFFETHYREIRKRQGFFYKKIMSLEQIVSSPNGPIKKRMGIEFLRAALKECRGLIFLQEFLIFDPEAVRNYRQAGNNNNLIHILLTAIKDRGDRLENCLGIILLELFAKKCPELYFVKNSRGETAFDLAVSEYKDKQMAIYFKDNLFRENAAPWKINPRIIEVSPFLAMADLAVFIMLVSVGPVMEHNTFDVFLSLFMALSYLLVHFFTPPRFWRNLENMIFNTMDRLSPNNILEFICGQNLAHQVAEPELVQIVISSPGSANDQPLHQGDSSIVYPSPVGLYGRVRQRVLHRNGDVDEQADVHSVTPGPAST